jgi:hypothetical protein
VSSNLTASARKTLEAPSWELFFCPTIPEITGISHRMQNDLIDAVSTKVVKAPTRFTPHVLLHRCSGEASIARSEVRSRPAACI